MLRLLEQIRQRKMRRTARVTVAEAGACGPRR